MAKSFAQRWRVATLALVTGAGLVSTALLALIVMIVWKGPWTPAVEALRVSTLAQAALAMAVLMGASMIGLLVAGPLSNLRASLGGASVEVEGDK